MDVHDLFAATLDDLRALCNNPLSTEYDALRTSALLRKLLLDASPLAQQVNRQARLPLIFEVSSLNVRHEAYQDDEPVFHWTSAEPFGLVPTLQLKWDAFLNYPIVRAFEYYYTVRNLIKVVAHVQGGVHRFEPEDEKEAALLRASESLTLNERSLLHIALFSVGRVTHRALAPLQGFGRA